MTLGMLLVYVFLGLSVVALVIFPNFRKRLHILTGGILNNFIIDKAKTPDGARAIYQQAIDKAQEQYNHASDMLNKTSGKLELEKKAYEKCQADLRDVESKCEQLVKAGKIESATVLAEKRDDILSLMDQHQRMISELMPMVHDAKVIATQKEQQLRKLKADSKKKVAELEANQAMGEMYDQMDDLKRTTTVSKLLDSVNDGCDEARQKAVGARTVYENRLETKANNAMLEAKTIAGNDYISSLQKKYNKVGVH